MSGHTSEATQPGSVADMVNRMRAVLPFSWFPAVASAGSASQAPVLDSVLSGVGTAWAFCFEMLQYVRSQARLATASGCFLDLFAVDFFGSTIRRTLAETDDEFRQRLSTSLLIPRATRTALNDTLVRLVEVSPWLFEPRQARDTGALGVAGFGYGSATMPFQYLVMIDANGGVIRRESEASYLDGVGRLWLAPRHAARPVYANGLWQSFLVEPVGYNLLKDSTGWGGWSVPASGAAAAVWAVDQHPATALWSGQAVMEIQIGASGAFSGPSTSVYIGDQTSCASIWVWLPSGHTLTALQLSFGDQQVNQDVAADLSVVNGWQRLVVSVAGVPGQGRTAVVQLSGSSTGEMSGSVLTQCWQVEAGSVATSFIPSSGQIGFRDADRVVGNTSNGGNPVILDGDDISEAIGRTTPAGSIAWLALQHAQ